MFKTVYAVSAILMIVLWGLLLVLIMAETKKLLKQGRKRKEKTMAEIIVGFIVSLIKITLSVIVPVWNTIMACIVLFGFTTLVQKIPEQVEESFEPIDLSLFDDKAKQILSYLFDHKENQVITLDEIVENLEMSYESVWTRCNNVLKSENYIRIEPVIIASTTNTVLAYRITDKGKIKIEELRMKNPAE